ncbi:hypothetical protein L2E82_11813 [Cichorium intybus]|uniref:Uncharacterized protein n=1 Tax=Cichorium intybus TaxID=13427 RepID=A0ACB9GEC4_CICIN|nr:hypothetical protein L2E82_11813 [Cichorium intybus]
MIEIECYLFGNNGGEYSIGSISLFLTLLSGCLSPSSGSRQSYHWTPTVLRRSRVDSLDTQTAILTSSSSQKSNCRSIDRQHLKPVRKTTKSLRSANQSIVAYSLYAFGKPQTVSENHKTGDNCERGGEGLVGSGEIHASFFLSL